VQRGRVRETQSETVIFAVNSWRRGGGGGGYEYDPNSKTVYITSCLGDDFNYELAVKTGSK